MGSRRIRSADRRGQSMLEAIIASGIIVTAIASALTLVASSVKASKESETAIVAGNLAREGVEAVRNLRDSNWLAGREFDDGLQDGTDQAGILTFDPVGNAFVLDTGAADSFTDEATRIWRHTGVAAGAVDGLMVQAAGRPPETQPTPFRRLVTVASICDTGTGNWTYAALGTDCGTLPKVGLRVVSAVRWDLGGKTRTLSAEEDMFDWR